MSKLTVAKMACFAFVFCAATAISTSAQTFTSLHSFSGTDGQLPFAGLVQGTDGDLYGTTPWGGLPTIMCASLGCGTVYSITTGGALRTVHNFEGPDGSLAMGVLLLVPSGNFYGTTEGGGNGAGNIFEITPKGALTMVYGFCSRRHCSDGENPVGGLVQGTNGNFYGTTVAGGPTNVECYFGCGTLFEINHNGTLRTMHRFTSGEGISPWAGLVQGADGAFYGTTYLGGNIDVCETGCGVVFKITPGKLTTLHYFCSQVVKGLCTDGEGPLAGLEGTDGNFYGTTEIGGTYDGGTIYKITPNGALTTLYSFCPQLNNGICPDGDVPEAALIQGSDGNFYGTTYYGGTGGCRFGCGTVFQVTPSGTLTTLHSFTGTDGSKPEGALVQGTDGTFYGTTSQGGASNSCNTAYVEGCGTIFGVSVGLGPFVKPLPTSGAVGAAVKILGTNLTGATSVTFNGVAATFTVKSKSEITTTVPTGATTGTVQVVTPGGTLLSNVPFRVLP